MSAKPQMNQRCPKCGSTNELEAVRCAACRAPLLQVCPRCGTTRRWYVAVCPECASRQVDDSTEFTRLFSAPVRERFNKRYIIQEVLLQGIVSSLYLCEDTRQPGTSVVVKELQPTALFRATERRSAEISLWSQVRHWQALTHPALIPLLDAFGEGERYYLVMPYVSGLSMSVLITDDRWRVTPSLALNWALQLCQLLVYLDQVQSAYRLPFLAPQHVMVAMNGQVQVIDYGFKALFAPNDYGPYGSVAGYSAPELQQEPPSFASDMYSLGRLLYAVLVKRDLAQSARNLLPLREAVSGISDSFARVIARSAQKDPAKRFRTPAALLSALQQATPTTDGSPSADWLVQAMHVPQVVAAARKTVQQPAASRAESMADLGFTADPRYGARASNVTGPDASPVRQTGRKAPPVMPSQPPPALSVSPRAINITHNGTAENKRVVLTLHNRGETEVEGQLRGNSAYLSVPTKPFRLAGGKTARAIINIAAEHLPAGKLSEPQALAIETNAGRLWVALNSDTASAPLLRMPSTLLDFGVLYDDAPRGQALVIQNAGTRQLSGRVSSTVPWLSVPKPDFRCAPQAESRLQVTVLTDKLPAGQQDVTGGLIVDSDGGQEKITVRAWRPRPVYNLDATVMDFGHVRTGKVAERVLMLGNQGDGQLEVSARSLVPYLQVHPQQGTCQPGEFIQFTLLLDCAGMSAGSLDASQVLRFSGNAGTRILGLRALILAPRMVLGSERIDFGQVLLGQEATQKLQIRNDGTAPLQVSVQPLVDWLRVSSAEMELQPGTAENIGLTADTKSVGRGVSINHPAGLRLRDTSGVQMDIPVQMTVIQPSLILDSDVVDFGFLNPGESSTRQLVLSNNGTGDLAWQAQSNAVWVEITPSQGFCPAGESRAITLSAYSLAFETPDQDIHDSLIINSDGGRVKVTLRAGTARPLLATDTTMLELVSINEVPAEGTLRIFNHGLGNLVGTIAADKTWLVPDKVSFTCPTGRSVIVPIHTDPHEVPVGIARVLGHLLLTSNGGESTVEVSLDMMAIPELRIPEERLMFVPNGDRSWLARITLQNAGMAPARVTAQATTDRLKLNRELFDIKPGKSVRLLAEWKELEAPKPAEVSIVINSETQSFQVDS